MQHDPVKKPESSQESVESPVSEGRSSVHTTEQGASGVPLYLQRQPIEEEEEEMQAKLKVGAPDDKYEQQADRVADQVMRMPDSEVQRQPEEEDEEEEMLQSKPLVEAITPLVR